MMRDGSLVGQNKNGKLSTEVLAFPLLESIDLAYNEFTGTLPTEYVSRNKAPHLINLEVHGNHLTGTIPKEYYFAKDKHRSELLVRVFEF
jgi:hypothetical protein